MPGSKIVVNHRVMLSRSAHHSAIGGSRLLYIANRPGAVRVKSYDDLRIERENERMAKLGYIGFRPGSVPEPNGGHALFDAHGVPERAFAARAQAHRFGDHNLRGQRAPRGCGCA